MKKPTSIQSKKVVIALSGGVDSAVAAYLLKKQGYQLTAIFMENWDDYLNGSPNQKLTCSQTEDWQEAQKVAQQLAIPLEKISFLSEYWKAVFTQFLFQLKKGLTPNPDVWCNRWIKFLALIKQINKRFKPDFLATGHYAKIINKNKKFYLGRAKDQAKDQTYFLSQIKRSVLSKLIFPLAELTKKEVRQIAQQIQLTNAKKKDSTGLCFIGERNFNQFLANYLPSNLGKIVEIESQEVKGEHQGFHYSTIGQRRGLGLQGNSTPYYVVAKETRQNLLYVAPRGKDFWLYTNYCWVKNLNWLIKKVELPIFSQLNLTAKFRYRQPDVPVRLVFFPKNSTLKVEFTEKQRAITPGQSAVFYWQDICLGGGIISASEKLNERSEPIAWDS